MAKRQPVLTKEQREQRRAELRELVVASIEQLRSSNGWRAYLTARACFRSYSVAIWRGRCHRLHVMALQLSTTCR